MKKVIIFFMVLLVASYILSILNFETPLALIEGYAEGLKLNVLKIEEKKNFYCDVIIDEAKKMDSLVRDWLDLSYMESGYFKLNKQTFYLKELIDHAVEKYEKIFLKEKIRVTVEVDEDLQLYGELLRIEQVLTNYLNNAIRHVDDEKQIKITCRVVEDKVKIMV